MKISKTHGVTLLKLNTFNTSSGRFYPLTCFTKLPSVVQGLIDKSGIDDAGTINSMMVGFTVKNIRIEQDELLGDIDFLSETVGDLARAIVRYQGYQYRAVSLGAVDSQNVVSNAELLAVYLTKD